MIASQLAITLTTFKERLYLHAIAGKGKVMTIEGSSPFVLPAAFFVPP
jgi:hypothetical protein